MLIIVILLFTGIINASAKVIMKKELNTLFFLGEEILTVLAKALRMLQDSQY